MKIFSIDKSKPLIEDQTDYNKKTSRNTLGVEHSSCGCLIVRRVVHKK
jgi:hypothetical protein